MVPSAPPARRDFAGTRLAFLAALAVVIPPWLARAADEAPVAAVAQEVDTALRTVVLIGAVLVVLILFAAAFMIYRKAFTSARGPALESGADPLTEAERETRRGNPAAAAERYEAAGEKIKAGECWEQARELARAAECYEAGGDLERAAQLYVRSGASLRAAGVYMQQKNYIEAAKIFRNKGDHLRAAQALELYGNRVGAARAYSTAGSHARAARLFEEERMYAEAAEAYRPLLDGDAVVPANADRHATYAALLALAGEGERAIALYRRIVAAVPGHPRAADALARLLPPAAVPSAATAGPPGAAGKAAAAPRDARSAAADLESIEALAREIEVDAGGEDPSHRVFTLRSMIHAGRMEPRYSMRLWVQVMRALAEQHRANQVLGCLTPDSITIDMENNVRVAASATRPTAYVAPEVQAGLPPDRQADIYSMGVVLFELVTGSLEDLGAKRAGELYPDIPPWLDELIGRCTEKNLTKRYRTTEEISAALQKLKSAAQE